ncbi:MAG TPA: phytanoyl-CoA dioxygenase family protein [Pyrinomonadaceae bacterium]
MLSGAVNRKAIRENFERDGFVLIEKIFDEIEMREIDRHLDQYMHMVVPNLPRDRVFFEAGNIGKIKSMNRINEESDFFSEFKEHPKIKHLVANIFDTEPDNIVAETLQFFGKPALEGSITPWHQDNGFQHYEPPESLMIWLALADVDEEMGCVVFAKGSHELGVVPHVPSGVLGFSQTVKTPPDPKTYPEVKAVMRRGSISLHHCNTFHRSGANETNRPRPALSVNYRTKRAIANLAERARVKAEVAKLIQNQDAMMS